MSEKIFEHSKDGRLVFIGNFEGLYAESQDPWDQSNSSDTEMTHYYNESREHLIEKLSMIKDIQQLKIAEVGCGLGYVMNLISKRFKCSTLYGFDISQTAINRAKQIHSRAADFQIHDITKSKTPVSTDIVILSNLLWYILEDINEALYNAIESISLANSGSKYLIIHNAFFKKGEQKYGNDVVSCLNDILHYISLSVKKFDALFVKSIEGKIIEFPNCKYDELFISIRFK